MKLCMFMEAKSTIHMQIYIGSNSICLRWPNIQGQIGALGLFSLNATCTKLRINSLQLIGMHAPSGCDTINVLSVLQDKMGAIRTLGASVSLQLYLYLLLQFSRYRLETLEYDIVHGVCKQFRTFRIFIPTQKSASGWGTKMSCIFITNRIEVQQRVWL